MLAYRDGKRIRLVSRNGVDHTRRFPELAAAVGTLRSSSLVLDAEVAIFDRQLRSRFEWLREPVADVASPSLLMVFDLLYRAGHDLSRRPLRERRERLEELVAGGERIFPVRRLAPNGLEAWAQVLERGYEGMVGKDDASPYDASPYDASPYDASPYVDGRTKLWLKVKVLGWTDPENRWHRVRLEGGGLGLENGE
jgi:bifunctional non-homologous end joining protein LigD